MTQHARPDERGEPAGGIEPLSLVYGTSTRPARIDRRRQRGRGDVARGIRLEAITRATAARDRVARGIRTRTTGLEARVAAVTSEPQGAAIVVGAELGRFLATFLPRHRRRSLRLEQVTGIEPVIPARRASVSPQHFTCGGDPVDDRRRWFT